MINFPLTPLVDSKRISCPPLVAGPLKVDPTCVPEKKIIISGLVNEKLIDYLLTGHIRFSSQGSFCFKGQFDFRIIRSI